MRRKNRQGIGKYLILPLILAAGVLSYFNSREIYSFYLRFYYEKIRGQSVEELSLDAESLYQKREYEKLAECLRTLLAAYPDNRDLRTLEGLTLIRLGEARRGSDAVLSAAEGGPMNERELEATVLALFERRQYRDVVDIFTANSPGTSQNLLYCHGVSLYHTGRYAPAAAELGRAIDAGRNDCQAYHYLGLALDRAGNPRAALPHLERARAMNGEDPAVARSLAAVYRRLGRYDDAARLLRTIRR